MSNYLKQEEGAYVFEDYPESFTNDLLFCQMKDNMFEIKQDVKKKIYEKIRREVVSFPSRNECVEKVELTFDFDKIEFNKLSKEEIVEIANELAKRNFEVVYLIKEYEVRKVQNNFPHEFKFFNGIRVKVRERDDEDLLD